MVSAMRMSKAIMMRIGATSIPKLLSTELTRQLGSLLPIPRWQSTFPHCLHKVSGSRNAESAGDLLGYPVYKVGTTDTHLAKND
jgi:hypothetical protein